MNIFPERSEKNLVTVFYVMGVITGYLFSLLFK